MPLGMVVGLRQGADPAALPQKGRSPQFSAHIYFGQTAAWIKMPLGMEVGLGPGNFVFGGDPATQKKGTPTPPSFLAHVHCGQTSGWMKMPLGTEVDLGPGHIVLLDGGPISPQKEHSSPHFRPMSIVATVAHLTYCSALVLVGMGDCCKGGLLMGPCSKDSNLKCGEKLLQHGGHECG